MINIYKAGGKYKKQDGTEYSIKTINESDKAKHVVDGWVCSLDLIDDIEDAVFEEMEPVKEKQSKSKKVK